MPVHTERGRRCSRSSARRRAVSPACRHFELPRHPLRGPPPGVGLRGPVDVVSSERPAIPFGYLAAPDVPEDGRLVDLERRRQLLHRHALAVCVEQLAHHEVFTFRPWASSPLVVTPGVPAEIGADRSVEGADRTVVTGLRARWTALLLVVGPAFSEGVDDREVAHDERARAEDAQGHEPHCPAPAPRDADGGRVLEAGVSVTATPGGDMYLGSVENESITMSQTAWCTATPGPIDGNGELTVTQSDPLHVGFEMAQPFRRQTMRVRPPWGGNPVLHGGVASSGRELGGSERLAARSCSLPSVDRAWAGPCSHALLWTRPRSARTSSSAGRCRADRGYDDLWTVTVSITPCPGSEICSTSTRSVPLVSCSRSPAAVLEVLATAKPFALSALV